MTDEQKPAQQKLDDPGNSPPGGFKKGYDPRRWMKGRPHAPKDAGKLLNSLIWDVFSEELVNPKDPKETVDRLRIAIRTATTSKNQTAFLHLLDRVAGKVAEKIDVASDNKIELIIKYATDNKPPSTP